VLRGGIVNNAGPKTPLFCRTAGLCLRQGFVGEGSHAGRLSECARHLWEEKARWSRGQTRLPLIVRLGSEGFRSIVGSSPQTDGR
jgi:hypothetical protein